MRKRHRDDPPSEPNEKLIEEMKEAGVPEEERMPNAGGTMSEGSRDTPDR